MDFGARRLDRILFTDLETFQTPPLLLGFYEGFNYTGVMNSLATSDWFKF